MKYVVFACANLMRNCLMRTDADPSAGDEGHIVHTHHLQPNYHICLHYSTCDAHAAGQRASPRTPHIFLPMRNNELDPSFQGLCAESSPLAPPVFDKTPNLHQDSLTPSVDGTEHVTQSWEVSQQLRDFGIQKTVAWNKHPYLPSPFSCV